jgi:uncharacterized protein
MTYQPRRVLITGASSGIGATAARAFAARKADLVLVARRRDRLTELADQLAHEHGVRADVVDFDLGVPGAGRELREAVKDPDTVDTVINNAGFATYGPFAEEDPERVAQEVTLNIGAVVDLTRAFLPQLVRAGHGAVVNVASTAAFQPIPSMAVYGATKAFVLSFTEAVSYEVRKSGVKVTALCPGATRTEFFDVAGTESAGVGKFQTADQVVATMLAALDKRSTPPSVVSGLINKLGAASPRLAPRRLVLPIAARAVH